jgi:hypothetical protein
MKAKTRKQRRKKTSAGKRRTSRVRFPEIKGKVLESVELALEDDENYISLSFADKTALHFDLEPQPGFTVQADYADWKTHNMRRIKTWPALRSRSLQE